MLISREGLLRVFLIKNSQLEIETNISDLMCGLLASSQNQKALLKSVHLDNDGLPVLLVRSNLVFYYNKSLKAWNSINVDVTALEFLSDAKKLDKNSEDVKLIKNMSVFIQKVGVVAGLESIEDYSEAQHSSI